MKGLAILLVDDEPLMRLSMVDALEAVGYDVHAVASGTEGIEVLRQKPFDLVITENKTAPNIPVGGKLQPIS